MSKKIVGLVLTTLMALCIAFGGNTFTVHAENEMEQDTVASVKGKNNIVYDYDSSTHTVTITGTQISNGDNYLALPADTERVVLRNAVLKGYFNYFFSDLKKLKSVEFVNSKITNIAHAQQMFKGCSALTGVDLSCIDVTGVIDLSGFFSGCSSLRAVNFNQMNTAYAENMNSMFQDCTSLEYIDMTGMSTSFVEDMGSMFYNCKNMKTVKFGDINTCNLQYATSMFNNCTSLSSIDIQNLNLNSLGACTYMFVNCSSLKKLELPQGAFLRNIGMDIFAGTSCEIVLANIPTASQISAGSYRNLSATSKVIVPFSAARIEPEGLGYRVNTSTGKTEKIPGFVIYGYAGYTAETYAEENGFPFVDVGQEFLSVAYPVTNSVKVGESVDIVAFYNNDRDDNTFQWQKYLNGSWVNLSVDSAKKEELKFPAGSNIDHMRIRCVITDYKGNKTYTNEVYLSVKTPITKVSASASQVEVCEGSTAKFSVKYKGYNILYKWYYERVGSDYWEPVVWADSHSSTLSFPTEKSMDGYSFYCVVRSDKGECESDIFTLAVHDAPAITKQPEDIRALVGTNVAMEVKASGYNLTYQWQKSTDGGQTWSNCTSTGATTSKMVIVMKESFDGYQFRCKITSLGKTITTRKAVLTLQQLLKVTKEPASITVLEGKTATFKVTATGENLRYRWQKSSDGGKTWEDCSATGAKTNTLSFTAKVSLNGLLLRVQVYSENQACVTHSATLTVKAATSITTQPVAKSVVEGANVAFQVVAHGESLKYQWQKSTDGGSTWANCTSDSATTAKLTLTAKESFNGYKFRCKVTGYEKTVTSSAVKLTVEKKLTITSQPASQTVVTGADVKFAVVADGKQVKYQWKISKDGGATWTDSGSQGADTATLSLSARVSFSGYKFKCEMTSGSQTVTSKTVTLTVKPAVSITGQPTSQKVQTGTAVTFQTTASGTGMKYQWKISKDGGATWTDSGSQGAGTTTLSLTAKLAFSGYKFKCVVTDQAGNTAESKVVTLTVTK